MVTKTKDFSATTYVEIWTGAGQLLEVKCVPGEVEKIKDLFSQHCTIFSFFRVFSTRSVKNIL